MSKEERHAKLAADIARQQEEARSDDNRYFAGLFYGRKVVDIDELMFYYIEHGGAKGHRLRVEARRKAEAAAAQHIEP